MEKLPSLISLFVVQALLNQANESNWRELKEERDVLFWEVFDPSTEHEERGNNCIEA